MRHEPHSAFAAAKPTPFGARLHAFAHHGWQAYLGWLKRQAARRALGELDDRMLKDIGISRGEIEAIVRGHKPWRNCSSRPGLG